MMQEEPMFDFFSSNRQEVEKEHLKVVHELSLAIAKAQATMEQDQKEVLLDQVMNLAWAVVEISSILEPSVFTTPPFEPAYRRVCGFQKRLN